MLSLIHFEVFSGFCPTTLEISLWIILVSLCDEHVLLGVFQAAVVQHSWGPLSLSHNCCCLVGEEEVPKRTNKNKLADANHCFRESTQSMVPIGLRNNSWLKFKTCLQENDPFIVHLGLSMSKTTQVTVFDQYWCLNVF